MAASRARGQGQRRGPGLVLKLFLLSTGLLIIPWFSLRQLLEMESLMAQAQARTQLLTARGIATLLNGREDLFDDFPVAVEDFAVLYVLPLPATMQVDGDDRDWPRAGTSERLYGATDGIVGDGGFGLTVGERDGELYGLLRVRDDALVPQAGPAPRLDRVDHVRLFFRSRRGDETRLAITFAGDGGAVAHATDARWQAIEGAPQAWVQAALRPVAGGAALEFSLPLAMLQSRRYFGLSYVDVDGARADGTVAPPRITQSLPSVDALGYDLVVVRSPEVAAIIQGLTYAGARVLVLDARRQVRAEAGSYRAQRTPAGAAGGAQSPRALPAPARAESLLDRLLSPILPWVRWLLAVLPLDYRGHVTSAEAPVDRAIARALAGTPATLRRELDNREEIIMAVHPIISARGVIGAVVVEENTDAIAALQRQAVERVTAVSALSLFVVMLALLAFSLRLAWRIRSLRQRASGAIDNEGRLQTVDLGSHERASDELGDLARSIAGMLSRLQQHTRFLETIPRTLRHELNNPLNTLSTSLHNLESQHPALEGSRYLDAAKRGVLRIGGIVQHLADAASLEESLREEEREELDLGDLVRSYVSNCQLTHSDATFVLDAGPEPLPVLVADYRIEQLLDKLVDNAIDFHTPGTPIVVGLRAVREQVELRVENTGPLLPGALLSSLFESMVSSRAPNQDGVHFGLGLYVVRVIAEHHGGSASAANRADGSGVVIAVRLPRAARKGRGAR